METLLITGNKISITDDGYLTDFSQWDKTIGNEIAKKDADIDYLTKVLRRN